MTTIAHCKEGNETTHEQWPPILVTVSMTTLTHLFHCMICATAIIKAMSTLLVAHLTERFVQGGDSFMQVSQIEHIRSITRATKLLYTSFGGSSMLRICPHSGQS
jgi:hypothetical protein